MNKSSERRQITQISDAAVQSKTGKTWQEWFALLDKAGAKKMSHKEIVACLSKNYKLVPWWQQMVTVTYEQSRGLREKHEKPEGYQIGVSRTMAAPVSMLYQAWQDEKTRQRWLPAAPMVIRKATANKSIRITWIDRKTSVEVNFYAKSNNKSQVVVQHSKLPSAMAAARMKKYWSVQLDRLQEILKAWQVPGKVR
ncbi:MAG: DUF4287 domain-containing protein [candidate division KSB1 bacterium]|nr:DUF4287 domain-containing protein [candidate division KSB1 bacterium]MDZ7301757.1 DUF4287 domain-containing protein [candidate division KSB1 bacterium]MDZ7311464.1 DUF4287 domain-containing protein [candidate division KSB1 bacterium]